MTRRSSVHIVSAGVLAAFFLSGLAALIYQTAWLRQFSIVFGTSELAVAIVLAAYMGGLAVGAALAARLVDRVARPVLAYGLLEGGIALSALAVPLLLAGAGWLYVGLLGGQPELPDASALGQPLYYAIVAFIVLAVPTTLMGATLPLLTRHAVRSNAELGSRVAWLYAANAAGAAAGTLAAAFILLPRLGLNGTVWSGVAINVLIFGLAAALARKATPPAADAQAAASPRDRADERPGTAAGALLTAGGIGDRLRRALVHRPAWILPLILLSGANAFLYEVLWTRLLSHVLGSSIYAFATMLAPLLAGIAIGSSLGGTVARDRRQAAAAFAVTQVAIAVLSAVAYASMQGLVPESRSASALVPYVLFSMLPAAIFIGATFPLAVRVLATDETDAARSSARVFSWNTIGAIVGSLLAAFWLIPMLGFSGAIKLAVTVNLLAAVCTSMLAMPFDRRLTVATAALLALTVLLYAPGRPQSVIAHTPFAVASDADRELYFAVGRSATVLVSEADGVYDLRTNGLPEAAVLPRGAAPVGQMQQWLTALPLIARPDAQTMLLVGFGGGVALENAPASLRTIDVVELEPEVVAANRRLAELRLDDPLADPRVNVVLNDARNALRLSTKRFDVIASQPSHPWTAGASHLFSSEFFMLARDHLDTGGVFVQWMSAGFVDGPLLRSLTATLVDVFGYVRLYQPAPGVLLFLASDDPLVLETRVASSGEPIQSDPIYYSYMRLNGTGDLLAALALDEEGTRAFSAGSPLTTDDRNRMATDSRSLADGLSVSALDAMLAAYDPLADGGSRVHNELARSVDLAYVATRLLIDGQLERATRLAAATRVPSTAAVIAGLVHGRAGRQADARLAFLEALDADPDNQTARYALVQPRLAQLALGIAQPDVAALARGLSGAPAAVVAGWRFAVDADWQRLAALDAELARSQVTALWFPEATQLRADWRTHVVGDSASAAAALRMVDRVLAIRPSLDLLVLRAASADAMGDADVFVESARYAVHEVRDSLDEIESGRATPSRAELDSMFRQVRALRARLVQVADDDVAAPLSDRMGAQLARIQMMNRE